MRFIETKKLNDYILSAGHVLNDGEAKRFFAAPDALQSVSLQGVSIESDMTFLREIATVLNVITSIIYHPHLSNKREEVVIRVEQAQQLNQESFLATVKDSKLWKEHDLQMIPEEVYYHQHIDELRIYENRFIGFLTDLIDKELAKFSAFYLLRLPTLTSVYTALDAGVVGDVIEYVDLLRRKTQFIKNTFFYREVSKGKPISRKVQPTNILLKDRLYRYCFRFYKSFVRYEEISSAKKDLRAYYTILILRELSRRGYRLIKAVKGSYSFDGEAFSLTLEPHGEDALALTVKNKSFADRPARHLLQMCVDSVQEDSCLPEGFDGKELLSLWELREGDASVSGCSVIDEEAALVRAWLDSKTKQVTVSLKLYQKYCPVCGSRGAGEIDGIYSCAVCKSTYMFDQKKESVWFRRIGRRGSV